MKKQLLYILITISFLLGSCGNDDFVVNGLRPIYASYNDFSGIESQAPKPFVSLGKIINVGDYLFINEIAKGIHVVDNSNPSNPITILFWSIPGNTEFTIEGTTLYADNGRHLIVIDITDFTNIQYIKHIEDVYINDTNSSVRRPPSDYVGWFICPNIDDGFIVDWVMEELTNPNCEAY